MVCSLDTLAHEVAVTLFSVVYSLYLILVLIERFQTLTRLIVVSSWRGPWAGEIRGFGEEQHG